MASLSQKKCAPCHSQEGKFNQNQIKDYIELVPDWSLIDNHHIQRSYKFKNFADALTFVNKIGVIAEQEGHHPDIEFGWGKVKIILWTHSVNGLSENDFILAAKFNELN
ncbi:MAG: 4a-hydroxytetrahydrobiopterin dehydratase [Parachlamydiales bacterium]|nr:4a-hydroxytetrahydrobiopterin dehydratase [Parachlamydiales bacterium]